MSAPLRVVGPPRRHPTAAVTLLWVACWEGRQPAECLDRKQRGLLVALLVEAGMTDVEIARHTWMTLYTTVRIRQQVGLSPNRVGDVQAPRVVAS
jgi:hypothetical protein